MSERVERDSRCPFDVARQNSRTGRLEIHPCDKVAIVYRGDHRLGACEIHATGILGSGWRAQATYQDGIWILPTIERVESHPAPPGLGGEVLP